MRQKVKEAILPRIERKTLNNAFIEELKNSIAFAEDISDSYSKNMKY